MFEMVPSITFAVIDVECTEALKCGCFGMKFVPKVYIYIRIR